jgi:hypothetical protein
LKDKKMMGEMAVKMLDGKDDEAADLLREIIKRKIERLK